MTYRLTCSGDSQTAYGNGWCPANMMWPHRLEDRLKLLGMSIAAENYGVSGDTTAQVLARMHQPFRFGVPDIGVHYAGVNDDGVVAASVTTANTQAAIKALKHGAYGTWHAADTGRGKLPIGTASVSDPTALPANAQTGARAVCLADTVAVANGGATPNAALVTAGKLAASVASIPSTSGGNSGQSVWECCNAQAGVAGWHRVVNSDATAPTKGTNRIVVISTNYLNWTTGGDTPTTPLASRAAIRAATQAAVTAEQVDGTDGFHVVNYVDLYAYQKSLIMAGTFPDFSSVSYDATKSWHTLQNNQHHNALGNQLVMEAIVHPTYGLAQGSSPVLTKWLTDLAA